MANALSKAVQAVKSGVQSVTQVRTLGDAASVSGGINDLIALREQSFSEVILEAIGVTIPLPTQEEAFEFYQKFEGKQKLVDGEWEIIINENPNNPLAYIDPKTWTNIQYLEYKSDLTAWEKTQGVRNVKRKAGESYARALKRVKKEVKAEKKRFDALIKLFTDFNTDLQENLKKDTPEDLKAKGIQSFPELIQVLIKQTAKTFFSSLATTYKELGLDLIDRKEAELKEQLGIDDITEATPEEIRAAYCPTPAELDKLIIKRNNMVEFLNKQQNRLNNLLKPIELAGETVNFLQITSNTINLVSTIVNNVVLILPPGVIKNTVSSTILPVINKIKDIRQTILVDKENTPRLPKIRRAISNVTIPLNQFSRLITSIVFQLNSIDELIQLCRPEAELTPLSPEVLATVAIQLSAELETEDSNLYKGFRLETETRKYTDTVNQNRGVAKNKSGIILLNTDWSFASDPNVLIRELKFRIDAENLQAY